MAALHFPAFLTRHLLQGYRREAWKEALVMVQGKKNDWRWSGASGCHSTGAQTGQ